MTQPRLAVVPTWEPSQDDRRREATIQRLSSYFGKATYEQRHAIWRELKRLINQRSPEYARWMERERGLGSE